MLTDLQAVGSEQSLAFEISFMPRQLYLIGLVCFRVAKEFATPDLFLLSPAQMANIELFIPKSHGVPRVDDHREVSGIISVLNTIFGGRTRRSYTIRWDTIRSAGRPIKIQCVVNP